MMRCSGASRCGQTATSTARRLDRVEVERCRIPARRRGEWRARSLRWRCSTTAPSSRPSGPLSEVSADARLWWRMSPVDDDVLHEAEAEEPL
jgi:hypothetical protein